MLNAFAGARRISQLPFIRQSVTLVSATAVSQAVSVVSAPVLARLYDPAAYGVLGVVMSIAALVSVLATLQYQTAILLPHGDHDGLGLTQLSIGCTVLVSCAMMLVSLGFRSQLAGLLSAPELGTWLLLVPVSVFLIGVSSALNGFANRHQRYRAMSLSRILNVVVALAVSLSVVWRIKGPAGLIFGYLAGQATTLGVLVISIERRDRRQLLIVDWPHLRQLARRYRRFAIYSTPTELANSLVNQLPVLLLTAFVGPAAVGFFSMTRRLLALPVQFIAGSVSEVFQQRASAEYARKGDCERLYVLTAKGLFIAGILPFIFLTVAAPQIFSVALGPRWEPAGHYARLMAGLFFMSLVASPLSYVFYIAERQREDMLAHAAMVLLIAGGMYAVSLAGGSSTAYIAAYSAAYSIVYLYYGIRGYYISRGTNKPAGVAFAGEPHD